MKNIVYVNRTSVVVNQKGNVVEGVRADASKNQRLVTLNKVRFESLRDFVNFLTKEGSKKSSITYVMDIRPATGGAYDARIATAAIPRTSTKSSKSTSSKATSSKSNSSTSRSAKRNAPTTTAVTPSGTITNVKSSSNSTRRASANTKASVNRKSR